jgi:hypothetical protein
MMIVTSIVALAVLPLVVLRGRTLLSYYAAALTICGFAWFIDRRGFALDPQLEFISLAAIHVAMLALFLARGRNVRFSAGRGMVIGAIVYALVIPAMRVHPPNGDEKHYLLVTESLAQDGDLDLRNQYATHPEVPRFADDPTGPHGEQYSRHEPLLSLLLLPGYLAAGTTGALAIVALFGVLLIRSTIRWMEDEGIDDAAIRAVFPFFALAPPVLFYATRAWPEVPAAFFFVEAIRGVRAHRTQRWIPALLGLVFLKLRFVLVAIGLLATLVVERRGSLRRKLIAVVVIVAPLLLMAILTGDATSVHRWQEIFPESPARYARGFFGLLTEGMSGIAFRAPFYLVGLFAIFRWKETPRGFRIGLLASLLYLFYLLPRPEWFGGWAPPLRYVVFLMPVLALGAASMWSRISRGAIALVSAWTIGLVIHGLRYPWRHFHEFTGENPIGEWLSLANRSDFSRFFPSFIRANDARWIGVAVVLVLITIGLRRWKFDLAIPLFSIALAAGFTYGRKPGAVIELEDKHVVHDGGKLYPDNYTLMRTEYRGGWVLEAGQSAMFLAQKGTYSLDFITGLGAMIEIGGQAIEVPPNDRYQSVRVTIPESGTVTLRCVSGAINADRLERIRE